MKIINCGSGLHEREVRGIDALASLPNHWFAYTNLDLATAPGSSREIDVIIVAEDRILVVDLKDWVGPIESKEGHWFNTGRDHGPSPVAKILANARQIFIQLDAHLKRYVKGAKPIVPKVQGLVVLTKASDLSGISETERQAVMPVAAFTSSLKSVPKRLEVFGKAPPAGLLTSAEWKDQLSKFFNVSKGVFVPGRRTYGGFYAASAAPVFEHPNGIFAEFEASDERQSPTLGVLRLWNFSKAETRFQTEEGRSEIAGREQEVIAYLQDRCEQFDNVIVDGKTRDPNFGVRYWEVYDRRRRLHRLTDFSGTELVDLGRADRLEIARQLLASLDALHLAEAAHLDIGPHSVWVQRPSTVRLSHLMAASYPDVRSLGESRYQFLSTGKLPEDLFGVETTPKRRDVFLAASAVHRMLLGSGLTTLNGIPEWDSGSDKASEYLELHGWFARALAHDPMDRFQDAGEALKAFNAAVAIRPTPAEVLEGLERHRGAIKSQMALFQAYPPANILRDDETRAMWRASKDGQDVLVKVWKRASWGDQQKEGPRILDFLDQLAELAAADAEGCAKILGAFWLGDAIVMVQEWIDLPDLARVIAERPEQLGEEARFQLIAALACRVEELHTLRLAHGDLKPANILVDPEAAGSPVVVDLCDFTTAAEGNKTSSRYAPERGGRYERDCFAVTVIGEELLTGSVSGTSARVRAAIEAIRTSDPANATLLPLIDALAASEPNLEEVSAIKLASPGVHAGPMLSDEGSYYLRRAPWGSALIIRGACEELEVSLASDGKPYRLVRRALEQSRIRLCQRFEFGSFEAFIVVEDSAGVRLDDLSSLLQRDDVIAALAPKGIEPEASAEGEQSAEEREIVPTQPPEDNLIEAIAAEPPPNGQVDVAKLWEILVDAERELVTYGQVAADSVFDRNVSRHKVPFNLLGGSFDYNRRDRVLVEREDRRGNWRPVGQLDLQRSKPELLFVESIRIEQRNGPSLVDEGDELRFRSRMEETSLDRRQAAVRRIVGRTSRTRNLIGILDPRNAACPHFLPDRQPVARLKEQYGLNEQQAEALSAVLATRPLGLVQGPPGTGKTVFIAALVHAALTLGLARNVLLASQAHEAVNNAAEAVLKLFARAGEVPSILRVGSEGVVSDRLLPFHVERVEQLQKDRFRAEMRERLAVAARGLGIPDALTEALTHVELAIRPVVVRLASLQEEDEVQRAAALRDTLNQQILPLGMRDMLPADMLPERMVETIVASCLKAVPQEDRPSADRVARFQAVAALARDFVGTVSTEQRSLETFLAGTRQIVAGTCVGLGRSALGLTSTPFELVIVDEAARCTASELAVPIQAGAWIVLVGDHKQLEPQHPESVVDEVAERVGVGVAEVARSDFERVFETPYGDAAGHTLRRQYRMLPPIGDIVSRSFYGKRLEHGRVAPIIDAHLLPTDLRAPVTWFDTAPFGARAQQADPDHRKSLTNVVEADVIVNLLKRWSDCPPFLDWLDKQTSHAHGIGIICAYSAQRDLVRRKIALASIDPTLRAALKVDTIDSYQGKENPIVIVSLVRNNWDGPLQHGSKTIRPGFLAKPNRINVAISRAMDRLVIVGSLSRWEEGGPMDQIVRAFASNVKDGHASEIDAMALIENRLDAESIDGTLEAVL